VELMISVVVPTYNERENLLELVERLDSVLKHTPYELIVIDDNSPDGTWELAERLAERYPIKVIKRERRDGLASAVIRGFEEAEGDVLVVMDADLQHPPELIPKLVKKLKDADIVVASRYVEGGGVKGWSTFRKLVSKGATPLAKLFLTSVNDPMSGFFALKRSVIEGVRLEPKGYKILLEILVKGRYSKVAEVPFIFEARKKGRSKLGFAQYLDYLKHLIALLRFKGEFKRVAKFAAVGASGIIVNEGVLFALTEFAHLYYIISALLGIELSIVSNFMFNDLWTFKDRRSRTKFLVRLIKANSGYGAGVVINLAALFIFTEFFGIWYILSNLIAIFITFLWNLLISVGWIWRR
jgi:dolichol-phosphate mannosyltransferase